VHCAPLCACLRQCLAHTHRIGGQHRMLHVHVLPDIQKFDRQVTRSDRFCQPSAQVLQAQCPAATVSRCMRSATVTCQVLSPNEVLTLDVCCCVCVTTEQARLLPLWTGQTCCNVVDLGASTNDGECKCHELASKAAGSYERGDDSDSSSSTLGKSLQ
jgi:hypothetical protein